ncbi:excalibur calcium-binding domain-containing protein [Dactylosporangium sp. CA-139066]|uniref:excalibur calcium-binding domain-containing protein n=1 Tax=Dactylosporangium sp. CA-139066 TaxID=3239930 RepID=UPI003D919FC3
MTIRRLTAIAVTALVLTGCGPDKTPTEPDNLVGIAPSASASPSPSDSPSPTPAATTAAAPTTVPAVPTPAATTKNPAPVRTTTKPPAPKTTPPAAVYYKNCDDVRAHGAAPLYRGQPGYRAGLDRDGDGVACE